MMEKSSAAAGVSKSFKVDLNGNRDSAARVGLKTQDSIDVP